MAKDRKTDVSNRHNYQRSLLNMIQQGRVPLAPGRIIKITVMHDDWCGIFRGRRCNCRPELRQEILAGADLN